MKTLADLPQFTVRRIESVSAEEAHLRGTFDRYDAVTRERWDYLYLPGPPYLAATVVSFDETTGDAVYALPTSLVTDRDIHVGSVLAWLSAYWTPTVIDAVLDQQCDWKRRDPAEVDTDLCEICNGSLEWGQASCYSSERHNVALCPTCWERYAVPHDLLFIFE